MRAGVQACLAPFRRTLADGVATLVQRTSTHPAVTIALMLPGGSAYDPAGRLGLAQFVSRVIDRGTVRRASGVIAEALDDRGVTLSIGVNRHLFLLSCLCLADDVTDVLDVIGDIVRNPVFPPSEVDTRRAEIITAIRQDEDNPASVASEELMRLLYPDGHPYGRPGKGSIASVQEISRDDLVAFHRERFFPSGLTVAVIGDIGVDQALRAVEQAFGDWSAPARPVVTLPPVPRVEHRQRRVIPMMNKAQVDVAYGFTALRRTDPDYYALLLMNNVLGQYGLGGRLGDSIRERQGMAYYAYSSFDGSVGAGPLVIRAGVAAENVDRALASIDEEVVRMALEGVTPAELSDAKQYLIGSMPRILETNNGIATFLLTAEFFGLGLDFDRRLPGLLEAVTLDEVNVVARRLLAVDRAAVAIAGPYLEPASEPAA
jgi:zinc protease